jgi:hypothetical protein
VRPRRHKLASGLRQSSEVSPRRRATFLAVPAYIGQCAGYVSGLWPWPLCRLRLLSMRPLD